MKRPCVEVRKGMRHLIRNWRPVPGFVVKKSKLVTSGSAACCGMSITGREVLIRDDGEGTWCSICTANRSSAVQVEDLPEHARRDERAWAVFSDRFKRAAREMFPDHAEAMIAELDARAPVLDAPLIEPGEEPGTFKVNP